MRKNIEHHITTENTWVFVWKTTIHGVGHVGIQVGGEEPGDPQGVYRSVHPQIPVSGPLVVYPVPLATATSWEQDARSEATVENEMRVPDVLFHSKTLNATAMRDTISREIRQSKYQLVPGIHPWSLFKRAAEDITYQPTERPEYPSMNRNREEKTHNCATFVAEVLKTGGVPLNPSKLPWQISPNSIFTQLAKHPDFSRINPELNNTPDACNKT